ncbi:hypothetical protein LJK88_33210 [Paenibacillus sp. P26]|nr:hypothetical protein LJK88_33210 [Paenibacillus sp. P26]
MIIKALGYTTEPVLLEHVGKQFIRIKGQYFIPSSAHQISLLGIREIPNMNAKPMKVRTTAGDNIPIKLLCTGTDFIEVLMEQNEKKEIALIPMNMVINMEMV